MFSVRLAVLGALLTPKISANYALVVPGAVMLVRRRLDDSRKATSPIAVRLLGGMCIALSRCTRTRVTCGIPYRWPGAVSGRRGARRIVSPEHPRRPLGCLVVQLRRGSATCCMLAGQTRWPRAPCWVCRLACWAARCPWRAQQGDLTSELRLAHLLIRQQYEAA